MNFKENYHYLFVLFLFLTISLLFANFIGLDRHWTANYDHEFTLTYNALLFNNGKLIEYTQHPGYFTILFLSLSFKLLSIFNFITVDKLSLLSTENFDHSFQSLIFYTRIYSSICIAVFCSATYALFYKFSKLKLYSYILSLLIFSSFGTIYHIAQLRTELIAMFFIILSLISLKIFFEENSKYKFIHLCCFFLFSFCALLNKMQVFFYFPFLFLIFYFCENKIEDFNIKEYNFLNKNWMPYVLFFIIIFYLYIENNTYYPFPLLSAAAVLFNLTIMNLFFFLLLRNNSKKIRVNLVVINLCFISIFFLLKSFLSMHPSTSPMLYTNLTRIMHSGMYIPNAPDIQNSTVFISVLIGKLGTNFLTLMGNVVFKQNIYGLLITLNLLITVIFRKLLTSKIIKFNIACLIAAIFVMLINSYRSDGNIISQYYIFSDLIIVLSFCSFSKVLKLKYLSIIFILTLCFTFQTSLKYVNSQKISEVTTINSNIKNVCKGTYFFDWQKQIDPKYFEDFCNEYLK